jgi:HEAT repeat protein
MPPRAEPPPNAAPVSHAELLSRLGSDDRREQRAACEEALAVIRKDRGLRDALKDLLRQGTRQTRFAAAWLLFRGETPSLRLLPALLDALELTDGDLRWEATHMLTGLGRLHGEVYLVLLNEAKLHPSPLRRRMSLYGLRELGPERAETEQAFLAALRDPAVEVRRAAFSSSPKLVELGPSWLDRALAILADDADIGMRVLAPLVLARIAELRADARPRILAVLHELRGGSDVDLARAAAVGLRRLSQNQE